MISSHKGTFFSSQKSVNCFGKLLPLDKPVVMGILNLTHDSFYDGGRFPSEKEVLIHTQKMLEDGAAIIDIGAVSTKPGSKLINADEEKTRLVQVFRKITQEFPDAVFSIDTYNSETARAVVGEGAQIINDISGGQFDEKMFPTIAELKVPYIIMHILGVPENMQANPEYKDVVNEVLSYFSEKTDRLKKMGVADIIIDPGFGFGKTVTHNYELLKSLDLFKMFKMPILAGFSRKSMINKILGTAPAQALNGTTTLNTIALMKGAKILRVHDVKEAVETIKLFCATVSE